MCTVPVHPARITGGGKFFFHVFVPVTSFCLHAIDTHSFYLKVSHREIAHHREVAHGIFQAAPGGSTPSQRNTSYVEFL